MRLKAGDCLRFAGLPDDVDCLAHSDGNGQRPQLFVERDQHPWLHRRRQRVEEVVALAEDCRLDVEET